MTKKDLIELLSPFDDDVVQWAKTYFQGVKDDIVLKDCYIFFDAFAKAHKENPEYVLQVMGALQKEIGNYDYWLVHYFCEKDPEAALRYFFKEGKFFWSLHDLFEQCVMMLPETLLPEYKRKGDN